METVLAPAKLTVTLRVTGVREDGYHLIDAEMITLDLHDTLEVGAGDELIVTGPAGRGTPRSTGHPRARTVGTVTTQV